MNKLGVRLTVVGALAQAVGLGVDAWRHAHDQTLDPATRERLARQLVAARDVALRYPTVADAERAGYRAVTPYLPLIGAHYIRFLVIDGTFDIDQPEMLLYDGTKPTSRIVGLSYY